MDLLFGGLNLKFPRLVSTQLEKKVVGFVN